MTRLQRASFATNLGLAIGYAAILVRDLLTPDIIAATDFTVFWGAWRLVLNGHAAALYDEAIQRATQKLLMDGGYFEGGLMAFLNPPHFALAGAPFGWLADRAGEPVAFAAWTACNLALLFWLVRMLGDEWSVTARHERLLLAAAVFAFYPVFVTVKNGQLSLLFALAVLGVYRAARAARDWIGGAWLTVLTIKPQLAPVVVLFLIAQRKWRMLVAGAAIFAGVAGITTLVVGPAAWLEYVRHVQYLEQFWGSGTPDYMLNARGALARIFGVERHAAVDSAAYATWLAGIAIVAGTLWRIRRGQTDARIVYAFSVAVGLFTNPHLFIHDAVIWTVVLVLGAAAIRDAGAEWRGFAAFALAWPPVFAIAGRLDIRSGPLTLLDLHTWTFAAAIVLIGRRLSSGRPMPDRAAAPGFRSVDLYRSWSS